MKELKHFSNQSQLLNYLYPKVNFNNFIIIKNEKDLVDLTSLHDSEKDVSHINKSYARLSQLL
jgi:hypothetical protein